MLITEKPGSEDDGGEQLKGHTAAADCGQDHPALRQGFHLQQHL